MIVCIHQPNYLPWLGFFHKIFLSDTFVYLDDAKYPPQTWTNRAYICCQNNLLRLSLPVHVGHWQETIHQVSVKTDEFRRKHLNSIRQTYSKSPYFDEVYMILEPHYSSRDVTLDEFNISLIENICAYLSLKTKFVRSSSLHLTTKKNELLIDIVKAVGGSTYVSGKAAQSYIAEHEHRYSEEGIALAYQNFKHPHYPQNSREFVTNASVIDALFNLGPGTRELFKASDPPYVLA